VLDPTGPAPVWLRLFPARRAALGLNATPAPAVVFILLGMLLGPEATGVLSGNTLRALDPVVSIALAALGIFVGLGVGSLDTHGQTRLLVAAWLEATLTIVVVGACMYLLIGRWGLPLPTSAVLFSLVLGVCACASAATRMTEGPGDLARVARIVDLEDVPLIALGTVAVALAGSRDVVSSLLLGAAATLLVAIGAALLFERARGDAERGVYVAGAVVLLGGVGAYAGTSPLLTGALAALAWVRGPNRADQVIARDLRALQHPLVALLLIVAGASVQWNLALLWIAAPLVLLRLVGKVLASAAAARLTTLPAGLLASVLMPPGVLGVALALNVQQVLDTPDTLLLSAVTVAAGVSELLSTLMPGEGESRP
jgi:hypothetical protein